MTLFTRPFLSYYVEEGLAHKISVYVHTFGLLRRKQHIHCTKNTILVPRFPDLFEIHYGMLQESNQVLILSTKSLISTVSSVSFLISGLVYVSTKLKEWATNLPLAAYPCPPPCDYDYNNTISTSKTPNSQNKLRSSSLTLLPWGSSGLAHRLDRWTIILVT